MRYYLTKRCQKFTSPLQHIYFDEINAKPIVFHWTWHLDDIDPSESVNTESLLGMYG